MVSSHTLNARSRSTTLPSRTRRGYLQRLLGKTSTPTAPLKTCILVEFPFVDVNTASRLQAGKAAKGGIFMVVKLPFSDSFAGVAASFG